MQYNFHSPDLHLNMVPSVHSTASDPVSTLAERRRIPFSTGRILLNKLTKSKNVHCHHV